MNGGRFPEDMFQAASCKDPVNDEGVAELLDDFVDEEERIGFLKCVPDCSDG